MELPTERLGYTYVVCTAGGRLRFDGFAGPDLAALQSLTPDLKQLTRTFTYTTLVTSELDASVLARCGDAIEMNVRKHR